MSHEPMRIEEFLSKFEIKILDRYNYYTKMVKNSNCAVAKQKISSLDYDTFNVNFSALKEAIAQIKMDINILYIRRGDLIGDMRMSEGKIAGVVTYRLAKAQIIHIHRRCNICGPKCHSHLNNSIAIRMGLDYVHKKYNELLSGIRHELIYTVKHRHVNQETLGLVFDTLKGE